MNKQKIVLIEEDRMLASLISFRLRKYGFQVDHVKQGKEVLDYLKSYTPNLIICNVMMPGLTAAELLGVMNDRRVNKAPVLLVGAKGQESKVQKAMNEGAANFVMKPVSVAVMLEKINQLISQQQGAGVFH